jgi:pSer/pThr/pTyr-binding forkhead associated (FHA) protein
MAKGDIPENVYLVISSQVYPITKEVTTIGRKLDNDIVIAEELVSRSHARIACESRQFVLYDLESTGGTYVNNKRIDRCVLYSGDIILLANIPVMFIHDATRILDKSKKRTGKLD